MAWRIDQHVIRGEIDNRVRGCVTGRIWFEGRDEPVVLELTGNAGRDLAGRRLEFRNPRPRPGLVAGFAVRQEGWVGDMTASRRVKVPEVSAAEVRARGLARQPFPWHWGNAVYLEWFSRFNGRVVIESASYELTIVGEAAWEMTAAEESVQARANAEALTRFVAQIGEVVEELKAQEGDEEDGDNAMTEEEAERVEARNEQLMDRVQARMDREGDTADFARVLEEEMARLRRERGEPEPEPDEELEAPWDERLDEDNRAGDEGFIAVDSSELPMHDHPLVRRARDLVLRIVDESKERGWAEQATGPEHPLADLALSMMKAGAKLTATLFSRHWLPEKAFCARKIVRLKRVVRYLEDATQAAEACAEQQLTDPAWIAAVQRELAELTTATHALIADLRLWLERKFE